MLDLFRRQLDRQFASSTPITHFDRPSKGWIKTIRTALGMTLSQLGERIHMTPQSVQSMEESEISASISLKTLEKAAKNLNCRLFYVFIPEQSLVETVDRQIYQKAKEIVERTSHSMSLENQQTNDEEIEMQIQTLVMEMKRRKNISIIWEK